MVSGGVFQATKAMNFQTGISLLSFQRLKTYTHLRPTEHDLFSERAIGSEPPFQKSLCSVALASRASFFRQLSITGG